MTAPIAQVIARWHEFVAGTRADLAGLLDDDVVFYSPIVYTPQRGTEVTEAYLRAAARTLPGDSPSARAGSAPGGGAEPPGTFRYTKQVLDGDTAVLEFETSVEGVYVNGVDIIRCNEAGKIVEFRVMVRPLRAVDVVHRQMASALGLAPPEPREAR